MQHLEPHHTKVSNAEFLLPDATKNQISNTYRHFLNWMRRTFRPRPQDHFSMECPGEPKSTNPVVMFGSHLVTLFNNEPSTINAIRSSLSFPQRARICSPRLWERDRSSRVAKQPLLPGNVASPMRIVSRSSRPLPKTSARLFDHYMTMSDLVETVNLPAQQALLCLAAFRRNALNYR